MHRVIATKAAVEEGIVPGWEETEQARRNDKENFKRMEQQLGHLQSYYKESKIKKDKDDKERDDFVNEGGYLVDEGNFTKAPGTQLTPSSSKRKMKSSSDISYMRSEKRGTPVYADIDVTSDLNDDGDDSDPSDNPTESSALPSEDISEPSASLGKLPSIPSSTVPRFDLPCEAFEDSIEDYGQYEIMSTGNFLYSAATAQSTMDFSIKPIEDGVVDSPSNRGPCLLAVCSPSPLQPRSLSSSQTSPTASDRVP